MWDKESLNPLTFTINLPSVKLITTWLLVKKSKSSRGIDRESLGRRTRKGYFTVWAVLSSL